MQYKKTSKAKKYQEIKGKANSLLPKNIDSSSRGDGYYYKASTGELNCIIDDMIVRYNTNTDTLMTAPNPYGKRIPTYMGALNPIFELYHDSKEVINLMVEALRIHDACQRYDALVKLASKPIMKAYVSNDKGLHPMMMKNFFNHAGLSHGRESSRLNGEGLSNYRGKILTDWLLDNPSAVNELSDEVTDESVTDDEKAEEFALANS